MKFIRVHNQVEEEFDLEKYFFDYKIAHPEVLIKIGTDSKQAGTCTMYVTTVCFVHPSKGVHVIYQKRKLERVKDIYTRLFKEAEMSIEVVDFLKGRTYIAVHLDYTSKASKSSNAGAAVIQWLKSSGYIVECKPDAFAASKAADGILKRKAKRLRTKDKRKTKKK